MSRFFTTKIAAFEGLHFITVKSNALNRRADLTVFQPAQAIGMSGIPLVILLHGVYGSHWSWVAQGNVHQTTQALINAGQIRPMVLVMPSDGLFGDGSGYVPHRDDNYETWIVEDVIEVVREQFSDVTASSPVYITGLSMGGFGALRLGAKYPQVFRGFSGLSSITHFDQLHGFVANFATLQRDALEQDGVLDWLLKNKAILPPFRFDCGEDDPLLSANRSLHESLVAHHIDHIYEEFAGAHAWDYWQTHIERTLLFFNQCTP
ncbi:alpha/beta hydrolase [Spirosoma endbachense]|uniref:Esterase family protein n=1 Tax=Spirosoma endbachense TaxID=2666025 RepID=A0A6P1VUU8_9BACT|nr:alpha/beta fold hydrolase [Spirosoma endbachense]QHV96495.1 esterase family protein [Spirosoma endbachense]